MPLSLFSHNPKTHLVDEINQSGTFGHTFGGTFKQFDLQTRNSDAKSHLIYRIDLSDPNVDIEIPGVGFLPLVYHFEGDLECSYRVEPDGQINILNPMSGKGAHFDVPDAFPLAKTSFSKQEYDPTNADDVMRLKGVFGWDELSRSEKDRALEIARTLSELTEADGIDESWSYETVIECMYEPPYSQGDPLERCKNPACKNFNNDDTEKWMKALAIQDNASIEELIWPDKFVQTIWMRCLACNSITAVNRCS